MYRLLKLIRGFLVKVFASVSTILSGRPEASHINNFADKSLQPSKKSQMIVRYTDGAGVARIKGGRDLKASQAYPGRCFVSICNCNLFSLKGLLALRLMGQKHSYWRFDWMMV